MVSSHRIGIAGSHQAERFLKGLHRHQLGAQTEAVQQACQVILLDRAVEHDHPLALQVEHRLQRHARTPIHLRPAGQRRHTVKVKALGRACPNFCVNGSDFS